MGKYKPGDKFLLEIREESTIGPELYCISGNLDWVVSESLLDNLERYEPHPFDFAANKGARVLENNAEPLRPYRAWHQLVSEPDDMTPDEKERLKRIRAIPSVAFEAAREREAFLREQVIQLEKERDALCDFFERGGLSCENQT